MYDESQILGSIGIEEKICSNLNNAIKSPKLILRFSKVKLLCYQSTKKNYSKLSEKFKQEIRRRYRFPAVLPHFHLQINLKVNLLLMLIDTADFNKDDLF